MDLITLDETFQQKRLIENWDHLLWTERYNAIGDFQLKTGNVDEFLELLPEGTLISLRESTVPMIVETHQIDRPKNAGAVMTITGRDFCSVLDRRVAIQAVTAALAEWLVVTKTPSDVAHYIIYKVCVEGFLDAADIFPPDQFQLLTPDDYLAGTGPNRQFNVPRGKLLTAVLGFLQTEAKADPTTTPPSPAIEPHGIRAMRPDSSGSAIGMEIYKGTDRSETILFDASRDLLEDGKYLFSKVGSATVGYILGEANALKMDMYPAGNDIDSPIDLSGFNRRVELVDATSSGITNVDALKMEGARTLGQAHVTALFDGSVNQDLSPYIFNRDYFLGDIVKTVGDYGLDTKSRVTEYIRSEDATGYKAYPTLTAINPDEG